MNFRIGDKVNHKVYGVGEVKYIRYGKHYAVEFEEENDIFHTCSGFCKNLHGYWCLKRELELSELELLNDINPEEPLTKTEYNNLIGLMANEIYSLSKEAYPHTDIWKDTNEIILCFIKKLKK